MRVLLSAAAMTVLTALAIPTSASAEDGFTVSDVNMRGAGKPLSSNCNSSRGSPPLYPRLPKRLGLVRYQLA
jgi:hypothetical protein